MTASQCVDPEEYIWKTWSEEELDRPTQEKWGKLGASGY